MPSLTQSFGQIRRPRILILGDLMLDRYTWGNAERISPEAPVMVLRADQEEVRPGGAASVAYLLRHLDAEISVAGVVGNDADGHTLRALFKDEGIDDQWVLVDPTRITTAKHRLVGRASNRHPHQILRVDYESRASLPDFLESELWNAIYPHFGQFDAILIADYLKGVCTERLLRLVIDTARECGLPVLVDPGRLPNYERYRGATLLKPNRLEAEFALGGSLASFEQATRAGMAFCESLELEAAVITLDRDGMVAVTPSAYAAIATNQREIYDITGAGDMVLAMLGLCIAGGLTVFDAAKLANIAAGLEVERFGIAPVKRSEIAAQLSGSGPRLGTTAKIVSPDVITRIAMEYRQQGKHVVFTNGCFDLLHVGHVTYLQEAATLGDVLIVAVNSDASVSRLKGPTRPIIPDEQRATLLAALECVDHVVIFDEDTPRALLERIHPNILVKGGSSHEIVGRELVEAYGGQIRLLGLVPDVSTTGLLEIMTRTQK